MSSEQLMNNMKMILTEKELKRIISKDNKYGIANVHLDLHGLNRSQARKLVKNVINANRGEFILDVIHGFNHGTSIKKLLQDTDWGNRVISKKCPDWNPGRTYLSIAA